jgi:hypothetical protein
MAVTLAAVSLTSPLGCLRGFDDRDWEGTYAGEKNGTFTTLRLTKCDPCKPQLLFEWMIDRPRGERQLTLHGSFMPSGTTGPNTLILFVSSVRAGKGETLVGPKMHTVIRGRIGDEFETQWWFPANVYAVLGGEVSKG